MNQVRFGVQNKGGATRRHGLRLCEEGRVEHVVQLDGLFLRGPVVHVHVHAHDCESVLVNSGLRKYVVHVQAARCASGWMRQLPFPSSKPIKPQPVSDSACVMGIDRMVVGRGGLAKRVAGVYVPYGGSGRPNQGTVNMEHGGRWRW
jgi:hypothetical protein